MIRVHCGMQPGQNAQPARVQAAPPGGPPVPRQRFTPPYHGRGWRVDGHPVTRWRNDAGSRWAWRVHRAGCPYGSFLAVARGAVVAFTMRPCTCTRWRRLLSGYRVPYRVGLLSHR